ncbi:unnamed protein product [Mucor fragilis]
MQPLPQVPLLKLCQACVICLLVMKIWTVFCIKCSWKKPDLSKKKLRYSGMYKALAILKAVIEDTQLWNEAGGKQEMTFYQRFASYLNTLMIKIGLNMLEYVRRTFLFVLKCIFISRCA